MNLVSESSAFDAVKTLLSDLERVNQYVEELEAKLVDARDARSRLVRSIEFLRSNLLHEASSLDTSALHAAHKAAKPLDRLSNAAKLLIETLKQDASKTWKIEELQESLREGGEEVSDKYASNTMRKLYAQGLVSRVGRGLYRVNDVLLSFEGFTEEDLEE